MIDHTLERQLLSRASRGPRQQGRSDAAVIAESVRDPEAFGEIFDRYWPQLHGYCTSRAGAAGEDIAAATFRAAFGHRRRYDRRAEDARPWLYAIATNLLRVHFRSSRRGERAGRRLRALVRLDVVPQPLAQLEATMLGPDVAAAIESLAEIDREALLLLAWAELDYDEIARALNVPVGTVRSRIHRARAQLKTRLTEIPSADPQGGSDA